LRRRLLSIVGALGLVAGLLSSAVAVQAETEPASQDSLIWTWSSSSQNVCIDNGTSRPTPGGVCSITQLPSAEDNVAICVENNTTIQSCVITQTQDLSSPEDNRALVVQHISQWGGATQNATQSVTITQTSGKGRNDAWILQAISQSTNDPASSQAQNNNQADTIDQVSLDGGGQSVGLGQVSWQNGQSGTVGVSQFQTSNQDVSESENQGHHINQTSAGHSKILVGQLQTQRLHGPSGASQTQKVDPRCCSTQGTKSDDTFNIFQLVYQKNDANPGYVQRATSVAQCSTSGKCTTSSTTNQNGVPTSKPCGPDIICTTVIDCTNGCSACSNTDGCSPPGAPCFPLSCGGGYRPTASLSTGTLAIAPRSRSQAKPLARSAPLLT